MKSRKKKDLLPPQLLIDGEKVHLNYDALVSEKDYQIKSESYKIFIEQNKDNILTVKWDVNKNPFFFVTLVEAPKWLWYTGNLIKSEEKINENK